MKMVLTLLVISILLGFNLDRHLVVNFANQMFSRKNRISHKYNFLANFVKFDKQTCFSLVIEFEYS